VDTRAELLIDELATHPVGQAFDFNYWRGRFQTLFAEKLDSESREALLQAYANMLDLMERGLAAQGHDPTDFKNAREADWRTRCLEEALQRSGIDLFEPGDLNEIVQREVAAGRMPESGFTQLAADGADVMGRQQQSTEPRKKGFFSRLFR
jgi:hypothetical protein